MESNMSMFIGVAIKQDPVTLAEMKETYGILVPDGKTFKRLPESSNYQMEGFAPKTTNGDRIGVLLEFY